MKGFLGFGGFIKFIAVYALFFGVLTGTTMDLLRIVANPFSIEVWKNAGINMIKIVSNAQLELSTTVKEFPQAVEYGLADLAILRIIGCGVVSLSMIYLFYRFLKILTPSSNRLILFVSSIFLFWFVAIASSFIAGNITWFPFLGFKDLVVERGPIIEYILSKYST